MVRGGLIKSSPQCRKRSTEGQQSLKYWWELMRNWWNFDLNKIRDGSSGVGRGERNCLTFWVEKCVDLKKTWLPLVLRMKRGKENRFENYVDFFALFCQSFPLDVWLPCVVGINYFDDEFMSIYVVWVWPILYNNSFWICHLWGTDQAAEAGTELAAGQLVPQIITQVTQGWVGGSLMRITNY